LHVPAVFRAFELMRVLSQAVRPLTLSEIAQRLDCPLASCHRIMRALEAEGLIARDLLQPKAYCIGTKLFQMASAAFLQQPIIPLFHSIADVLKNELHQAVYLCVPAGAHTLVVAHVPSPFASSHGVHVGLTQMLHESAAGRAIIGMLDTGVQTQYWNAYLSDRPSSASIPPGSVAPWLCELAEVKRVGYASSLSGADARVRSLAAPVLDRAGEPLAAMAIRFSGDGAVRDLATPLIQATQQLSSRMG
jgi:DNA-binding IclR family transcriptional regulator